MDKGDKTSLGSFPLSQVAEEQPPIAQDVQNTHLPDASPLNNINNNQDNATRPTLEKLPKQRTKLRVPAKQDPTTVNLKDFKELMIRLRLDDWKARAQIVYNPGKVDATALWSPQFAGIESTKNGMISFDGFDRIWFVPFDLNAPIPSGKQSVVDDLDNRRKELGHAHRVRATGDKEFHDKIVRLIEDEVKETCQSQWSKDVESHMPPTQWIDVQQMYDLPGLVSMIARARLEDGREPLPGYYQAIALELGIDGKVTYKRTSMPSDVDVKGLISRLESWYPHSDEHSIDVIKRFRHKLDLVSEHVDEARKRKCQTMYRQLGRFIETEGPECELTQWIFRLWVKPDYSIPAGKSPDRISTWTKLKEDTYKDLLAGVHINKYPVFVRKIRVRRWWFELTELGKQIETSQGEAGLSAEQLDRLDKMLARRTDEEKEQDARSKEALDMAKMAMM
ncbi:unnamed protein product [Fusarium graminearum]|uniref:Chromosome 3, complete genome n=2 Tax=Gibberella zeae TaxID=5518 RepID=I1RNJ4_GIBZE|nr:hypothetical protein FGSG_05577 [Fusarium graminearum PH-1]EYB26248.1 hypothetical protein FG05_05577 [Fusarium graminearum]ESU11554.1 hypothetical protein FGSG_05577 [Fusarium graminearum PH-1]KAI6757159.1 hypothetical protein HG531_002984 [Fusarium graminearum]PCD40452.1 hypothetical protein FGRA07_01723 [Fusarium graminearum]CAF3464373.1 unnamed protein product [Fusarium graminearum]|eukprot:XP_011324130.1 hypothetical protein FGSG_05577 [Fusarium graminearum PH-1]